jgi:hypothetical protein
MIGKKTAAKPMKMRRRWRMSILQWRTVNVVPLAMPWSNRYRRADGRAIHDPCPGLMIQERGGESRVVFATYHNGVLIPAVETAGYEESSTAGGSRSLPYRPGPPPWELLDEVDPVAKVAADAANAGYLAKSFTLPPPKETTA